MQQIVTGVATVENRIHTFFHNQALGQLLRKNNIRKEKGACLDTLFQFMLALAFTGKNLYRLLESPGAPVGIGRDMAYQLLNSVTANWRRFLHLLSMRVIVQRLLPSLWIKFTLAPSFLIFSLARTKIYCTVYSNKTIFVLLLH